MSTRDRNGLFWILGFLMYVFYLVGHSPVSDVCYYLRDTYTEAVYRFYIQLTGKVLLALHLFWVAGRLGMTSDSLKKTGLWSIFIASTGYYYHALIKFDIEYVHFIQYCCLTMVMFYALKQRYPGAIAICLAAGLLDESYQANLSIEAINWRDVLLNVLGVVWGWLVLQTLEVKDDYPESVNQLNVD